jgi:hypothetical protein
VKDTEFEIYHGDTLTNDSRLLCETNPAKVPKFDAVAATFLSSYRGEPTQALGEDVRFSFFDYLRELALTGKQQIFFATASENWRASLSGSLTSLASDSRESI